MFWSRCPSEITSRYYLFSSCKNTSVLGKPFIYFVLCLQVVLSCVELFCLWVQMLLLLWIVQREPSIYLFIDWFLFKSQYDSVFDVLFQVTVSSEWLVFCIYWFCTFLNNEKHINNILEMLKNKSEEYTYLCCYDRIV